MNFNLKIFMNESRYFLHLTSLLPLSIINIRDVNLRLHRVIGQLPNDYPPMQEIQQYRLHRPAPPIC